MRKFVGIVTMLTFVITTMMPPMAHASNHNHKIAGKTQQVSVMHDCDHDHEKAGLDKTAKHDSGKKPCCDNGICKCPGGTCHNGLVKVFNNSEELKLGFASSVNHFGFVNQFIDSGYPERLKRPPKA